MVIQSCGGILTNGLLPFLTDCISFLEAKLGSVRIRVDRTGFISLRLSCYKGGTHHAHVVCDSHVCVFLPGVPFLFLPLSHELT